MTSKQPPMKKATQFEGHRRTFSGVTPRVDGRVEQPEAATTEAPPPPAEHPTLTPAHVSRKDGRTLKRMTLYLPVDLARRLAVHCAEQDIDMSAVVTEAVRRHLAVVAP